MHLTDGCEGRPAGSDSFRLFFVVLGAGTELGGAAGGGVHDRPQCGRERFGQHVDPAGRDLGEHPLGGLPCLPEPQHRLLLDHAAAAPGGDLDGGGGQLVGGHRGDPVDQVVRLVDDHHVVLGEDVEVLKRSMASRAWLVTTMSARPASSRASSAKHWVPNGQRCTPRHSRAVTETWRQA